MKKPDVLEDLARKRITADDLTEKVKKNLDLLPTVLRGISSPAPRVKYGCAKTLRSLSEEIPEQLYPHVEFFIGLLDSDVKILKWNAIDIVANLTRVDKDRKFEGIFKKYYGLLSDEVMITVAHVVDDSAKIARAKPQLTEKITDELLKVEKIPLTPHLTQECKNILLGKAIVAFEDYFERIKNKADVVSFVQRQLHNGRNATRVKAAKFMRELA